MNLPFTTRRLSGVLLALSLVACGEDSTGPAHDAVGRWVYSDAEGLHYYIITDDGFTTYHESVLGADCYTSNEYDIVEIDGDVYTLRNVATDSELEVEVERDGDDLIVLGQSLERTDVDESDLDVCTASFCGGLTGIAPGMVIEGTLSAADEENGAGRKYDAYVIDGFTSSVSIWLESTEIDPFLLLLDESSVVINANDNANESTLNAVIYHGVEAASCYIVVVTTPEAGDLGAYTLTVEGVI